MTDAELLAELAGLLDRLDPPPPRVHAAAVLAGAFLGVDWDLLDLVPQPCAAVRGDGAVWRRGEDVLIELGARVTGLVAPRLGVAHAEIHSREGARVLPVDEVGCFSGDLPSGRVRVVLRRPGSAPLVSPWLR
ncbi:hypothetical protein [Actinokineospora iranica]|uniref:Uncharacterized protein n=1 Tax=Actinokineospora iranica TaxID=1271860 RepID=A0A1G6QKI3_9PSEU|nr:hypothetical protein [Actinokineospora iranica]SDC92788.1 hypothetical protein SAMN05216174_105347 [Actinokineospora iranica]